MSLAALRKSRLAHQGVVTKTWNKHQPMTLVEPSKLDVRLLQDKLRQMQAKQVEFDDIQAQIDNHEDYQPDSEEEKAISTTEEHLERTITLLMYFIDVKQIHLAIRDLNSDLKALALAKEEMPDKDHLTTLQVHKQAYKELRERLNQSTISDSHEFHGAVAHLQERLSFLSAEEKVKSTPLTSEGSHHMDSMPSRRPQSVNKPKISLPKFHGDVMEWTSFWTRFASAIDSDPDLDQVTKLIYLQDAIKDPNINPTLFNGANNEKHYDEVVKHLKEMYDRPKLIHATYCKQLIEMSPIKNTQTDLNCYANNLGHIVLGLQSTGQFDIESCLTSLAVQRLPRHLKELWQVETHEQRMVAPIEKLISFIKVRAAAVEAGMAVSSSLTSTAEPPLEAKREKKADKTPNYEAVVNVSSQAPTFKYDCPICKPEKHSLYFCPKFNDMAVAART